MILYWQYHIYYYHFSSFVPVLFFKKLNKNIRMAKNHKFFFILLLEFCLINRKIMKMNAFISMGHFIWWKMSAILPHLSSPFEQMLFRVRSKSSYNLFYFQLGLFPWFVRSGINNLHGVGTSVSFPFFQFNPPQSAPLISI